MKSWIQVGTGFAILIGVLLVLADAMLVVRPWQST